MKTFISSIAPLLLVVAAAGCQGTGDAPDARGPGSAIASTTFTGSSELFVEFPPLVQGEESAFAAHVTALEDFTALGSGRVTVVLSGGSAPEERFSVSEPSVAGIFRPLATPETAGERHLAVLVEGEAFNDRHDLGTVTVYSSPEKAADASSSEDSEDAGGGISFLKEQQWLIDFATAPATKRRLRASLPANGRIRARPEGEARITAPITGRLVTVGDVFPRIGADVARDQVLAAIAPRVTGEADLASLDLQLEKARLHLKEAERDRNRLEGLLEEGAVPDRRVVEARHEEAEARAELAAAQSRLAQYEGTQRASAGEAQGRIEVRSPIAGTLLSVQTAPGAFVEEGSELFYLVDLDRVWLEVRVPEADLGQLEQVAGAAFRVDGRSDRIEVGTLEAGRLVAFGGLVDPQSRTVPLIFEVDNDDRHLRVGMFARASVFTGEATEALAIPVSAILDEDGQDVVYVQHGGESFERRTVTLGVRDGDLVEVRAGLEPTARVVTRGAYNVRLAASSSDVPAHGHAH